MLGEILGSVQETSAEDASAMIPHKAKGWGQQESKPHSVQRPEGRCTAYLCRCDYPWHRPELSCRLAAHEPDARGGCGLPPVLSTLAHGDFPRSVCNRSELLVCQLRSRASRAPRALHVLDAGLTSPKITSNPDWSREKREREERARDAKRERAPKSLE